MLLARRLFSQINGRQTDERRFLHISEVAGVLARSRRM
jgi:hypothetical protein